MKNSRRNFIKYCILGLSSLCLPLLASCKKRYFRPAELLLLGPISELLQDRQFIRERAMLVNLDDDGWSALSTRCTYEGCELSYQSQTLLCSCCNSLYSHQGDLLRGPSEASLPWFEVTFKDGKLWADSSKVVSRSHRFSSPKISKIIRAYRQKIREKGATEEVKIPKILLGQSDQELGGMFLLDDPDRLYEEEHQRWENSLK